MNSKLVGKRFIQVFKNREYSKRAVAFQCVAEFSDKSSIQVMSGNYTIHLKAPGGDLCANCGGSPFPHYETSDLNLWVESPRRC